MQKLNTFINEASMSRVLQHTRERAVGLITAVRAAHPNATEAERNEQNRLNRENNKQLEKDLKTHHKDGFIKVKGRYAEPGEVPQDEHSYMVLGRKNDKGELLDKLKTLGKKYQQNSILHKGAGEKIAKLHGTAKDGYPGLDKSEDVGEFHPQHAPMYHSLLKKNHPFAFGEDTTLVTNFKFLNVGVGKSFFHRYDEPDTEF